MSRNYSIRALLLVFTFIFIVLLVLLFGVFEVSREFALLCALAGTAILTVIFLAGVRGMAEVGEQLERMSAADPSPIRVRDTAFLPTEFRSLMDKFNSLLDRTVRAKLAEVEAISRVADSILIGKADGTITYLNEAGTRTFGGVTGRNLRDLIDPSSVAAIFPAGSPTEWKGDVAIHKLDGTTFDGFLSTTPILDKGNVTSIVTIIQDVTKEKAARESLMQAEKMITLGELVAGTSHELNNPLAIVTGYSDLLLEEDSLSPEQRTKVESIRKNALRASSVVHSLLAFARKRKPERVRADVNVVVRGAADLKDYDLKSAGIELSLLLAEGLPPVFADPNQLQQVLLNVINNAQDAVLLLEARRPTIDVKTAVIGDMVVITVEDNGSGIARSDIKKVFDPFFTTKPVGKGTGLGLSISYGIIREHNGDIAISSEPGEATRVTIELPVDTGEHGMAERPVLPMPSLRAMRILVVDDDPEIVGILRHGLARTGLTVDSAITVEDALALAGTINYDFILTDVKLPGSSGVDFYQQVRILNPRYAQRTIFLTRDTSNPVTVQFLEERGIAYFSKPFDCQAIDRYLRQRAASLPA